MATTVVNIHHTKKYDTYIGRPSLFGNPYIIGMDGSRDEVIEKYKRLFAIKLADPNFKREVLQLKDKTLGCFCAPHACHGDVIAEWVNAN